MPKSFLDRVINEILMPRFLFMIDQQEEKTWIKNNLSRKWREHRGKLFRHAEDPLLSKEDLIRKCPEGVPMDQWALCCWKNQQIRQNQITRTGGAKSLARRRAEMKAKEKAVDRGQIWIETHKRKEGSYVTLIKLGKLVQVF